jgi:hypothetical protein
VTASDAAGRKLWSWSKWAAVRDAALAQLEATEVRPLGQSAEFHSTGRGWVPLLVDGSFLLPAAEVAPYEMTAIGLARQPQPASSEAPQIAKVSVDDREPVEVWSALRGSETTDLPSGTRSEHPATDGSSAELAQTAEESKRSVLAGSTFVVARAGWKDGVAPRHRLENPLKGGAAEATWSAEVRIDGGSSSITMNAEVSQDKQQANDETARNESAPFERRNTSSVRGAEAREAAPLQRAPQHNVEAVLAGGEDSAKADPIQSAGRAAVRMGEGRPETDSGRAFRYQLTTSTW